MKNIISEQNVQKRCVVTGSSGLLGQQVVETLLTDCWEVFGVSRSSNASAFPLNDAQLYHPIPIDLSNDWDTSILPDQVDAVIHLSQSEHFRNFPNSAEALFRVNTLSTLKLLEYARKANAKTFIFASSGGVYGYGEQVFSEEAPVSPEGNLGFYIGSKLCSEVIANSYTSFVNIITLRFFFIYGPGQKKGMLVPRLVQSVRESQPITLQGATGIRINPIYVQDAAQAVKQALMLNGSHIINVAGPEVLELREIATIIGNAFGKTPEFNQTPDEARHLVGSIHKMSELLGPSSTFFKEGLAQYMQYAYPESLV